MLLKRIVDTVVSIPHFVLDHLFLCLLILFRLELLSIFLQLRYLPLFVLHVLLILPPFKLFLHFGFFCVFQLLLHLVLFLRCALILFLLITISWLLVFLLLEVLFRFNVCFFKDVLHCLRHVLGIVHCFYAQCLLNFFLLRHLLHGLYFLKYLQDLLGSLSCVFIFFFGLFFFVWNLANYLGYILLIFFSALDSLL